MTENEKLVNACIEGIQEKKGKKIRVVNEVATAIGLTNVDAQHLRGEEEKGKYDFIVSRAVMPLPDLMKIVRKNIRREGINAYPNGLICLKGGELQHEIGAYRHVADTIELSTVFEEPYFSEKKVVYVPIVK